MDFEGLRSTPTSVGQLPGFVVRADSTPGPPQNSTAKPERRVLRLDTCAPLPNLPNRSLGPQTPPRSPSGGPAGPRHPTPTNSAGSVARLPFFLLSAVIVAGAL